jgi:hypothetical protein
MGAREVRPDRPSCDCGDEKKRGIRNCSLGKGRVLRAWGGGCNRARSDGRIRTALPLICRGEEEERRDGRATSVLPERTVRMGSQSRPPLLGLWNLPDLLSRCFRRKIESWKSLRDGRAKGKYHSRI